MEECIVIPTPTSSSIKIQRLNRFLLYITTSQPYITFALCLYSRFQVDPKSYHFTAAKHILRYQKGTIGIGLWHSNYSNFNLTSYS